jgi:hypothetical protein
MALRQLNNKDYGLFLFDETPWPGRGSNDLVFLGATKWIVVRCGDEDCRQHPGSEVVMINWPKKPFSNYLKAARANLNVDNAFTLNAILLCTSNGNNKMVALLCIIMYLKHQFLNLYVFESLLFLDDRELRQRKSNFEINGCVISPVPATRRLGAARQLAPEFVWTGQNLQPMVILLYLKETKTE